MRIDLMDFIFDKPTRKILNVTDIKIWLIKYCHLAVLLIELQQYSQWLNGSDIKGKLP